MNFDINNLPESLPEQVKNTSASIIWLPGEHFAIHHLPQPTAPKRKWPELIPWLLEEQVLQDVLSMHFVVLAQDENNELITLTVANEDMQQWLDLIADKQLSHYRFLPDFLGLDWQPEHISVALRHGQIVVRYKEFNGFTAKPQLAWAMIEKLLQDSTQQLPILSFMPLTEIPESLQSSAQLRQQGFSWEEAKPKLEINLLTGQFQPQRKFIGAEIDVLHSWWPSVALVIITLGLYLGYLGSVNHHLSTQLKFSQSQYEDNYARLFPGIELAPEGIRYTVEQQLNKRFQQREKLAAPVMKVLTAMDNAISTCSSCGVQTLSLTEYGGEILLSRSTENDLQQIFLPDFHFQTQSQVESDSILLTVNRN